MADRKGDWMQTASGKQFWPIDPRPEEIDIQDIAHALSMMCRYGGHCQRFYSVAEHSYIVSLHVPKEYALWGLLHDASEAYLADIVKPAKPYIAGYKEAEARVMSAVCQRFGLHPVEPDEVKWADGAILVDEMKALLRPPPVPWDLPVPQGLGAWINCWTPMTAKTAFLRRFNDLMEA